MSENKLVNLIQASIPAPDIDCSLVEYNLSLSPEARLINHQRNFETLQELQKANKILYARSKQTSQDPS